MLILRWIINALALLLASSYVVGFDILTFQAALIIALILGLVNAIIRPVVFFLTLPINILTLGLFTFVINALMIWLVASVVKDSLLYVSGFWPAFWAAIILWVISLLTNLALTREKK